MEQYFYFWGVTMIVPIWLLLFLNKKHRQDMFITGVILGTMAVIIGVFYSLLDYWSPIYIIPGFLFEDFYYGFIFGGISTEFWELFTNKSDSVRKHYPTHYKFLLSVILLIAFCFWIFVHYLKVNSIVALIVPPIISGIAIAIVRKDLFYSELFNGILVTILTFVMFIILHLLYPDIFINHWHLSKLSGIFVVGIPIEELLLAFSLGFGVGNIYEMICGYSVVKNKKKNSIKH